MKGIFLNFLLLSAVAVVLIVAKEAKAMNSTKVITTSKNDTGVITASKNGTRVIKVAKVIKKKTSETKKSVKDEEQSKSASYHIPVLVAPVDSLPPGAVPIRIGLTDDYLQAAADPYPQEPNYNQNIGSDYPQDLNYIQPADSDYPQNQNYVQSVNSDYSQEPHYAPEEYYPENYGDLSAIPGVPGVDYPTYSQLPHTRFECREHTGHPGFYADVEARCQMWHYCQPDGRHDRFLCPNGTVFDQKTRVCNWWFNVDCDGSLSLYDINFDLYREPVKKAPVLQSHNLYRESSPAHNQDYIHPSNFHHRHDEYDGHDDYLHGKHIQSAASPQILRYPVKMAPSPNVVPDLQDISDPSSSYHHSDPDYYNEPSYSFKQDDGKFQGPVTYKFEDVAAHEEIPTYRERKAAPPSGQKYRVVKRRRLYKG